MKLSDIFELAPDYRPPEDEYRIEWPKATWLQRRLAEIKAKEVNELGERVK